MSGRRVAAPVTPESDHFESRILDALCAAGGSPQRTDLRNAIRPAISTVDFDQAVAALAARGEITGEQVTLTRRSHLGKDLPYRAMVYRIAPPGLRKPSTIPPFRHFGSPPRKPIPEGAALDERVLTVLREAGGTLARNKLRAATDSRLTAATLDTTLAGLLASGRITVKMLTSKHLKSNGIPARHSVTVYAVAKGRKQSR